MTSLKLPTALPPGGRIAVLAASSSADRERVERGGAWLADRGFSVTYAENAFTRDLSYLAGSDDERVNTINTFLRDPSFDAYFFTRGGYGAMRILDRIDYEAIAENPRPIVGYSDVTAIHQAAAVRSGVVTFHGPMLNFDLSEGLSALQERWLFDALAGESALRYEFEAAQVQARGSAEGILFGGCLSLTYALMGTPYDFWVDDGIWFWEDVTESTYRIDRMLTALRLSGRLQRIRAVLVGRLKDCGGPVPGELDRMINEFFADAGIPVVRDLPFGHHGDNLLLPVGARIRLDTDDRSLVFPEPLVVPRVR
jgi:muramoyltetrapeptide carboxypeptidase